MTRLLAAVALAPITVPAVALSYGMTAALALCPSLDVTRTSDPIVVLMRATAQAA